MITEKQKQQRTLGLFSSDAPRLMMGEGVQLWLEKTGQVEPENLDDNPRVQLGNVLESVILMAAATNLDKVVLSPPNTFYHPEHSRLGAHLDGVVNDEPTVVEAKAVSAYIKDREGWGEPGTDEVPDKVIWQVQHQLLVTGFTKAVIPVAFISEKNLVEYLTTMRLPVDLYYIPESPALQEKLLDAELEFIRYWDEGAPPPAQVIGDARLLYGKDDGSAMEAPEELLQWYHELMAAQHKVKAYEKVEAAAKEEIQRAMKTATELHGFGQTLVTWKNNKPTKRFDLDAFKKAHPDLHKQFLTEEPGPRVFLTKEIK